jgi:hypothetical protein
MVPNYDIIFKLKVPRALNKPCAIGQMEPTKMGIGASLRQNKGAKTTDFLINNYTLLHVIARNYTWHDECSRYDSRGSV